MGRPGRFFTMRVTLRALVLACLAVAATAAPTVAAEPPQPARVTVGAFMNNVPKVDLVSNSFSFDAYVWFRWDPAAWPPQVQQATAPAGAAAPETAEGPADGPKLDGPATTFEIIGLEGELAKTPLYSRPGYCCVQVKGERHTFWDVRNFPFDRQRIDLVIEDGSYDTRELVYEADGRGSAASKELVVTGFRMSPVVQKVERYVYETTFGDPALEPGGNSPYSRYTFSIPMRRESWGLFFKLFSGLFVCTAIAMIALFINATQVDPRFGLCVGGLFGIVGSSYLVSSLLPETSELCYADKLHIAGLVTVLVVVIESAISLSLHLNKGEAGAALAKRLDRTTFVALFATYAATTIFLTLQAIRAGVAGGA